MIRGGGFPEAEHLSDTGGPGCKVCSMNVNCSSGEMAVTVGNVQNLCISGTKERKERVRRGMKQRRRKYRRSGKEEELDVETIRQNNRKRERERERDVRRKE